MKYFINFLLIAFITIVLSSCSKKGKQVSIIQEKTLESQMIELYNLAYEEFLDGDTLYAAQKFNEAELLFPQSIWAPKSSLMAAYAYYSQSYLGDAIYEIEGFLKKYPKNPQSDYANFLLAMCYYEKIVDEEKDLYPLLKSQEQFLYVIKNYPNTDYALDAKYKLDLIIETQASKEMYIARHYIKKEKWIPAINRYKKVIKEFSTTIYVEEAVHRLVELHYKLGLEGEAKKYAALLGYNYQSSTWYEKTYILFNKDYSISSNKILKDKTKKNLLLRKVKSIFK